MDRYVPAQVTYWTGIWRPGMEAISNEVAVLRRALAPDAPLVSFSRGQSSALLWGQRTIRLSGHRWIALRAVATALEPIGALTHVWGAVDDWHLLRSLGRRPIVFSVVLPGQALPLRHYDRVDLFAAETEGLAAELRGIGIAGDRIRIVRPGVNLQTFTPAPRPGGPFRVLFASSPSKVEELVARGIPLLVELARVRPEIEVVLLWRKWGDRSAAARGLADLDPPRNLVVQELGDRTMPMLFQSSHVVACLYEAGFGKSCPNSLIESLACARPVLVSEHCGLAPLVSERRIGRAVPLNVDAVASAVDDLQAEWAAVSLRSRAVAVELFDERRFVEDYGRLYAEVTRPTDAVRTA